MMKSRPDTPLLLHRLAALGDMARLRILRLLDGRELSVGELARALQLPQSTVSRHLKLLHDGGWVVKRSEGTASLYCLLQDTLDEQAGALWRVARSQLGTTPTLEEDDSRLTEVLAARREDSKTFFGRLGSEWDHLRHELFGNRFTTEALLGFIGSDRVIADLGCGTGNAAEFLAPFVKKIIAVDREQAMLDAARKRLADFSNTDFRLGELTALPLQDGEIDAAMVYLVMHHVPDPALAVKDTARALKPGGMLLIVDMVAHDRDSYRYTMGHLHLGFDEATVREWADAAGMTMERYHRLHPDTDGKGPSLFAATMRK
jgi:ArsR family transcriptional regulator